MERHILTRRIFNTLALVLGSGFCSSGRPEPPPPLDLSKLPFQHFVTTGRDALAEWERLRALGRGYPIVVGDDKELRGLIERYELFKPADPKPILQRAQGIDPQREIARRNAEWAAEAEAEAKREGHDWDPAGSEEPEMGEWPDEPSSPDANEGSADPGPSVAYSSFRRRPLDRVYILIIPATDGWEVPAYLNWGNYNACPEAAIHVAALRDWSERYGAELVGISSEVIDLRVKQRPASREAAEKLALEQFRYCGDIVDQGTGDIRTLAAALMSSNWWYFWWD